MVKMLGGEHSIGMHIDGVKYELVCSLADSDNWKCDLDGVIYSLEDLVLKGDFRPQDSWFTDQLLPPHHLQLTPLQHSILSINNSSKNGHYLT